MSCDVCRRFWVFFIVVRTVCGPDRRAVAVLVVFPVSVSRLPVSAGARGVGRVTRGAASPRDRPKGVLDAADDPSDHRASGHEWAPNVSGRSRNSRAGVTGSESEGTPPGSTAATDSQIRSRRCTIHERLPNVHRCRVWARRCPPTSIDSGESPNDHEPYATSVGSIVKRFYR